MPPGFPAHQRRRINAQLLSHLPLRQAEPPARGGKAFRECKGWRQRIVTQELDDGWDIADSRGGCVAFPVRNCGSVNADLVGNLPLEKFEVEAARADVVA
jgi:hypothetical protein